MELFENTPAFLVLSVAQAREKNVIGLWQESMDANYECKINLSPKLNLANNPTEMEAALLWGAQTYGLERLIALFAITVQNLEHDGRIERSQKEWAKQFDYSALGGTDNNTAHMMLNSHPNRIYYAMPFIINAHRNMEDISRNLEKEAIFNAPEQEDDIEI